MIERSEWNILESIKVASVAAAIAHDGQVRKNTKVPVPYITHPARVAFMVTYFDDTYNYTAVISAWMHDILEDCGVRGEKIFINAIDQMPLYPSDKKTIVEIVYALTKDDSIHPRAAKWQDAIDKVINEYAPSEVLLVKLCDRIDNLSDIGGFKEGFIRLYVSETTQLIEAIKRANMESKYVSAFNYLVELTESMQR